MPPLAAAIPAIIGGIGAAAPGIASTAATGLATKAVMDTGSNALFGNPEEKARKLKEESNKSSMAQMLGQLLMPKKRPGPMIPMPGESRMI